MSAPIPRETFKTSRLMDFFSVKELTAQIGHGTQDWPRVVIKELLDNAMDACEDRTTPPVIRVEIDDSGITITDNGPSIAPETVAGILDYSVRVSSRKAYVSPCRGAQGNALKTLIAMPYVLDGHQGMVEIDASGIHHTITCRVDRLRQEPVFDHAQEPGFVKNGTRLALHWPESAGLLLREQAPPDFTNARRVRRAQSAPDRERCCLWRRLRVHPSAPDWSKRKPSDPSSPHWYTADNLSRLIAACVVHDEDHGREPRLIRELVAQFKGLTASAKQKAVLDATGLARQPLTAMVQNGVVDRERVARLLAAMQQHSTPIKPQALGIIGQSHLARHFAATGCEMESFKYARDAGVKDGIPFVIEMAFAWHPSLPTRRLITGVNWSVGLLNPFRDLGAIGRGLDGLLAGRFADNDEPILFLAHLAAARVAYSDRGKSAVLWEG